MQTIDSFEALQKFAAETQFPSHAAWRYSPATWKPQHHGKSRIISVSCVEVLRLVDLRGAIIIINAMGMQTAIAKQIVQDEALRLACSFAARYSTGLLTFFAWRCSAAMSWVSWQRVTNEKPDCS